MICERTGEKTKQGKASGKIRFNSTKFAIGKTRYLVTADPRHEGYQPGERVALVAAYNALPFLPSDDASVFAETFIKEMYDWTLSMRGEKTAPKDLAIDRVISFHPDDDVSPAQALELAKEAVEDVIGPLDSRVSLFSVHTDKKHTHVHFEASVVNNKGQIFNKRADDLLWNKAMDRLEKKYNLTRVIDRGYEPGTTKPKKPLKKKPSKGALQRKKRTGEPTLIEQHQAILDRALERSEGCFLTFIKTLMTEGLWLVANISGEKERVRGVGFRYKGEYFTGSDLGRKYTWGQLSKQLNYDADTHNSLLLKMTKRYELIERQSCELDVKPVNYDINTLSSRSMNSVLYRAFKHKKFGSDIVYRWKKADSLAFRETTNAKGGRRLSTNCGLNRTVIRAMLQRVKELDRTKVRCKGSASFMEIVTEIGSEMGITVLDPDNKPIIKSVVQPKPKPEPEPESEWEQLTVIEQKRVLELMEIMQVPQEQALEIFLEAESKISYRTKEFDEFEKSII
ncbi:MAG: hypothetical protein ACI9T7_000514 [Oleiphilaceae bacterium]|jgi:hypothetical protein